MQHIFFRRLKEFSSMAVACLCQLAQGKRPSSAQLTRIDTASARKPVLKKDLNNTPGWVPQQSPLLGSSWHSSSCSWRCCWPSLPWDHTAGPWSPFWLSQSSRLFLKIFSNRLVSSLPWCLGLFLIIISWDSYLSNPPACQGPSKEQQNPPVYHQILRSFVSFAKLLRFVIKSLMKVLNSTGSTVDPSDAPLVTRFQLDLMLLVTTL